MSAVAVPFPTHVAFSDESHHNFGRYRGIGLVTLSASDHDRFNGELRSLLAKANVSEFKWNELRTAQARFAALHLLDWVFPEIFAQKLRIDVLTWDTNDQRHTIKHRDDAANLQRMYYHLFKNVLRERWPDGCRWLLCPDEQSEIKWDELDNFLYYTSMSGTQPGRLVTGITISFKMEFSIHQILQCKSHEKPLVQVADLFAGLGVYSRTNYDCYKQWCEQTDGQAHMFATEQKKLSTSERERCVVLDDLERRCKQVGMGVSLKSTQGLRTMNPKSLLNFWWYEAQREADKAPLKKVAMAQNPL